MTRRPLVWAVALWFLSVAPDALSAEKPSKAFERYIADLTKLCKHYPPRPNETTCDILKTKPVDPLSTPEGRFAHSIQLPNPLSPDSGYRRGMTQDEYFDHLCKNEAGTFIYERVKDVQGIMMMRPRDFDPNSANHLYAPEAPFLHVEDAIPFVAVKLLGPSRFEFMETSKPLPISSGDRSGLHISLLENPTRDSHQGTFVYTGYDGNDVTSLRLVSWPHRKSRYGFTWRGISRLNDRELGIGGGELIVLDLNSNKVIALLRGYAKFWIKKGMGQSGLQWIGRCPRPRGEGYLRDREFLLEVLAPPSSKH